MLKKISHYLNADVLAALQNMGHGDFLILSNLNFPSDSIAKHTHVGKLLRMENITSAQAAEAILDLMPLDTFADSAAKRMGVKGTDELQPVQEEVQTVIDVAEGKPWPMTAIPHDDFLEMAKKAYCIIQTGERRFYGCFAFTKGVIRPDAA